MFSKLWKNILTVIYFSLCFYAGQQIQGLFSVQNQLTDIEPPLPEDFSRTEILDGSPAYRIVVTWHVYFTTEQIIFRIQSRSRGYVGFGLTRDRTGFSDIDLVRGGKNGLVPYFHDRHCNNSNICVVDDQQNCVLLSVMENASGTNLTFLRNFRSPDKFQDMDLLNEKYYFYWEHGNSDIPSTYPGRSGRLPFYLFVPKRFSNFERSLQINENVSVSWTTDFAQDLISFKVTARTQGYLAFGLSQNGRMIGGDLVIGGIRDHIPYFYDCFATSHDVPEIDSSQDWMFVGVEEEAGITSLEFYRSFDTNDPFDLPIRYEYTYFIWAYGSSDFVTKHQDRGSVLVNILDNEA